MKFAVPFNCLRCQIFLCALAFIQRFMQQMFFLTLWVGKEKSTIIRRKTLRFPICIIQLMLSSVIFVILFYIIRLVKLFVSFFSPKKLSLSTLAIRQTHTGKNKLFDFTKSVKSFNQLGMYFMAYYSKPVLTHLRKYFSYFTA